VSTQRDAAALLRKPPISPYTAEFLGTGIMLVIGLSAVCADFGTGSSVTGAIPSALLRRLITGTIFAGGAALVVYSILGRISGGHLNPAVTLAFLSLGKIHGRMAAGYVLAQVAGATVAAVATLVVWGNLARSVSDGATVPGPQGPLVALAAETVMTFALVEVILQFMRTPGLAAYTPLAASALVALLVTVEAPVSGTSLNPARSLGPALVAGVFTDLWIYFVGPVAGALAAVALAGRLRANLVPCAKLFHTDDFECHLRDCIYRARRELPIPTDEHARPRTPARQDSKEEAT
jgi:aquaporin Z